MAPARKRCARTVNPALGRLPEEPEAPGFDAEFRCWFHCPRVFCSPWGQIPEFRVPSCTWEIKLLAGEGRLKLKTASVLKRNADEIALPPDHAALADGVKFVEAQFEIQRQQIEGVEFDSGPGIGDVLNAASEDTALRVKEQQRVFRDRRPRYRSAFEFHSEFPTVCTRPRQAEAGELCSGGNQLRPYS
jgi:hypothetical protein